MNSETPKSKWDRPAPITEPPPVAEMLVNSLIILELGRELNIHPYDLAWTLMYTSINGFVAGRSGGLTGIEIQEIETQMEEWATSANRHMVDVIAMLKGKRT